MTRQAKRGKPPTVRTFVRQTDNRLKHEDVVLNHVIAGDTDSAYVLLEKCFGPDADTNEVVEYANEIGRKTNDAFPDWMCDVFNVGDRMYHDDEQVITTDRETVADKAFFKAKKNYLMHIVDKEGRPKDEHKITGLEIRKSDTPKVVQDFLKDMVLAILDGNDYDCIHDMIQEFKQQYKQFTLQQVGRPTTVKTLKTYEDRYANHGTMNAFPYHVRASMFYNSQCSSKDIKIRSGDKVAVCYIDHPDTKYIAVPVDADELPEFVNNVKIDWDTQWSKVEQKIKTYLTPIGWDLESRRQDNYRKFVQF